MPKRTDENHAAIMKALRAVGASVTSTHMVGKGFPDIVCALRGKNYLMEIKRDARAPLTPDEQRWHENWKGKVYIVTSPEEAVMIVVGHVKVSQREINRSAEKRWLTEEMEDEAGEPWGV